MKWSEFFLDFGRTTYKYFIFILSGHAFSIDEIILVFFFVCSDRLSSVIAVTYDDDTRVLTIIKTFFFCRLFPLCSRFASNSFRNDVLLFSQVFFGFSCDKNPSLDIWYLHVICSHLKVIFFKRRVPVTTTSFNDTQNQFVTYTVRPIAESKLSNFHLIIWDEIQVKLLGNERFQRKRFEFSSFWFFFSANFSSRPHFNRFQSPWNWLMILINFRIGIHLKFTGIEASKFSFLWNIEMSAVLRS